MSIPNTGKQCAYHQRGVGQNKHFSRIRCSSFTVLSFFSIFFLTSSTITYRVHQLNNDVAQIDIILHHLEINAFIRYGKTEEKPVVASTKKKVDLHPIISPSSVDDRSNIAPITVSLVILTFKKYESLAKLLSSISLQEVSFNCEIIIADNGCFNETKKVIDEAFPHHEDSNLVSYVPQCDNPGYAIGNNVGVKKASSPESKYLLFLNDDIVLSDKSFVQNMVELLETKQQQQNAAGVGCVLLNSDGSEIIEAGSIVWENGHAAGYGRGRRDVNAAEFRFPRPVDYVSGACLMVQKKVFEDYGGFDQDTFPNYYEDTDLQLHIQHDLGKEIWLQPKSVAKHDEHGSFGTEESAKFMAAASELFQKKWMHALQGKHVKNPLADPSLSKQQVDKAFFRASDLRARDSKKANILYIDYKAPNKAKGSGFGRSFDNLSMIAELGHRVTLVTIVQPSEENWCNDLCLQKIYDLGIEYVTTDWFDLVTNRIGYYDIVLVSRPPTLLEINDRLREIYSKYPFALIYDCEALVFRRDELLEELVEKRNIAFPGRSKIDLKFQRLMLQHEKEKELTLISMADEIIAVSDGEKQLLLSQPGIDIKHVDTIGHVMNADYKTVNGFEDRQRGILFLASFDSSMYYNGDAIWYFLEEVYPMVIKEAATSITLTIAGRKIPAELHEYIEGHSNIAPYVTFVESPTHIGPLLEEHRMFIAPHLYGAGIQYKVSEALSAGIPVVMSKFTYDSFGSVPGCIGPDAQSLKQCVLDIHENKERWSTLRNEGFKFINQTHSRKDALRKWSTIIDRNYEDIQGCLEGEDAYKQDYGDVAEAVRNGVFYSGFQHWIGSGKEEGRLYHCNSTLSHALVTNKIQYPEKPCEEGEEIYISSNEDVAKAINEGDYNTGFQHWSTTGKQEGRLYICRMQYAQKECEEGEKMYKKANEDVAKAIEHGIYESGFQHWKRKGRAEGRVYFC